MQETKRRTSLKTPQIHLLSGNQMMLVGGVIVVLVVLAALFAPILSPQSPVTVHLTNRLQPPGGSHWLGTDEMGRDLFSRILYGCRLSLWVGLSIIIVTSLMGMLIGCVSGYFGGWVDRVVMVGTDFVLSFPSLVFALALTAALGPGLMNAMVAIAVVKIPAFTRLARGQTLSLKEKNFVKSAQTFGVPWWRIILRHLLPHCLSPVLVQATTGIGDAILTASALSFIGVGAQPPTPELGAMISTARTYLLDQWWYATFPGIAIFVTVMGFNLLGDGLRDLLDPRTLSRREAG